MNGQLGGLPGHHEAQGWDPSCPRRTLELPFPPPHAEQGSRASPECKWTGGSRRTPTPTPAHATAAPKVAGQQLRRHEPGAAPRPPPGNARGPPWAPGEHTPLLTECPACGRGRAQAEGSQISISRGQRPPLGGCQALADKGPAGRVSHRHCPPALSRAALSGSGRTAHYHTAGLVNWARLGTRSGGAGVWPQPRSPPGCTLRTAPRTADRVASLPRRLPSQSQSSPQGFPETLTSLRGWAGKPHGLTAPHKGQRPRLGLADRPRSRPRRSSSYASLAPPPLPGSLYGSGGAQWGGVRSCRRPPGPVGTRGGMFLPLPPAQRVPPSAPRRAECRARPGGGCCERREQETPPPPTSVTAGPGVLLGTNGTREGPACAGLMQCVLGSWGTHLGCLPSPGRPGSRSSLSPAPGTRSGEAASWAGLGGVEGGRVDGPLLPAASTVPSSPADTPGRPHARTRIQPPACSPASWPRNAVGGRGQPVQTRRCRHWIKRKMLS